MTSLHGLASNPGKRKVKKRNKKAKKTENTDRTPTHKNNCVASRLRISGPGCAGAPWRNPAVGGSKAPPLATALGETATAAGFLAIEGDDALPTALTLRLNVSTCSVLVSRVDFRNRCESWGKIAHMARGVAYVV